MVEKAFVQYLDNAMKEYEEYKKLEKKDLTFQEFLLVILTWKTEEILQEIEERN